METGLFSHNFNDLAVNGVGGEPGAWHGEPRAPADQSFGWNRK